MTGEFSDKSGGYYKDDASLLVTILDEHGPNVAFENAKRLAAESDQDPVEMMRGVAMDMFGDESGRVRALHYLQWDAEVNPDVMFAAELSDAMYHYARYDETNEFATEVTGAAVVHLLNVSQKPDFVADVEYVGAASRILDSVDARRLKQQYLVVLEAVAPHVVAVAQNYHRNESIGDNKIDYEELEMDMLLATISGLIHRRNSELADLAQSTITDEEQKITALDLRSENLIIDTLLSGKFDDARHLIKDTKSSLFGLWWALYERIEQGAGGRELVAQSIETLLDVRPNYFADYEGDSAIDVYFGSRVGQVIALANRTDIIKPLLQPTPTPMAAQNTVRGCAFSLGQTNNQAGYEAMMQMPNAQEYADFIQLNFEGGKRYPIE